MEVKERLNKGFHKETLFLLPRDQDKIPLTIKRSGVKDYKEHVDFSRLLIKSEVRYVHRSQVSAQEKETHLSQIQIANTPPLILSPRSVSIGLSRNRSKQAFRSARLRHNPRPW